MGYQMTEQPTEDWNINRMPWRSNVTDENVINFVGSSLPSTSNFPSTSFTKTKRKFGPEQDLDL
jgi:hypothetical protein